VVLTISQPLGATKSGNSSVAAPGTGRRQEGVGMTIDQRSAEGLAAPGADPAAPIPADSLRRAASGVRPWSSDHPINLRLSIPSPFGRFYLTLVAGRERRNPERRAEERRRHPLVTLGNMIFLFSFGMVLGLAFLAMVQLGLVYVLEQQGILINRS
jgi:hypothetical protein